MNFTTQHHSSSSGTATSECGQYAIAFRNSIEHGCRRYYAWYHQSKPDQKNLAITLDREEAIQACVTHANSLTPIGE